MGKEIDFNNFSFNQSIEQTTKTMMEGEELQEMELVNNRLQEAGGKILDLNSIDYVLIVME